MQSQALRQSTFEGTRWTAADLEALAGGVAGYGDDDGDDDGDSIVVRSPFVDEPIGTIPSLSAADVDGAAATCHEAAEEWRERAVAERARILERFAGLVEDHREELVDLVQLETGKARRDAFEETLDVALSAGYYADKTPGFLQSEKRQSAMALTSSARVEYDPVGVVGIISPWNNPLSMSTDVFPALVAGNAVLWKPDDKTPFTALRVAELLREAGLPADVLTIVTGEGASVGPAVIDRVDYVTFTGSSETGRLVAEHAGRNLIDCSLELSGKNPMIVCADANLRQAVRGAVQGCYTNAGQVCLAIERIYVEEPVFEEFLDRFVAATRSQIIAPGFSYEPDVGTLVNAEQLDRVTSHVEDAIERGATLHSGGEARPDIGPFFFEPTIFTDLPDDSMAACEETFGPVVAVEPIASVDEAIAAANDSTHGLNASVWTSDRKRAREIASQLEFGTVCINDAYNVGYASYDAPMGGVKDSGIGRRHGPEGVKKYVEPKTIAKSRIGPITDPPFVPTSVAVRGWDLVSRLQRRLQ